MNITKRGDSYLIVVSDGKKGNKRNRVTTTYIPKATTPKAIEKEVNNFALEFEKKVKEGKYLSGEKTTFSQFAEIWKREWLPEHISLSSQERYIQILKTRLSDIGNMPISKVRPLHIQSIINQMNKEGRKPETVRKFFEVANSIFKYAYKMEVIQDNPCLRCELPSVKRIEGLHYFTVEQSKRFLNALEKMEIPCTHTDTKANRNGNECKISGYTDYHKVPFQYVAYFYLAIYGGFRRGEMVALKWNDIDFAKHTIRIDESATRTQSKGILIKEPKTKSSNREIVLPKECFEKLKEWKIQQFELSNKLCSEWKGKRGNHFDENFVFIQLDSGENMDVDTPTRKFKQLIEYYNTLVAKKEEEELPIIRLHDLRHTSATLLISLNVDIPTVSKRLGHSKASTTLDIYAHCIPKMDETASQVLHEAFAKAN